MTRIGTEVKFTLTGDQVSAGLTAFGLSAPDGELREVFFIDRPDEAGDPWLFGNDVILRVRCVPDGSGDVTVKLRPAVRDRLTGRWRPGTEHRDEYKVEIDWAAAKVLAASVTVDVEENIADRLGEPRKRALSDEQQDFLRRCGPELDQPMRDLRTAGPIDSLRWKDLAAGPVDDLRAEQWTWGDGQTFLEFSLRCDDEEEAAKQRVLLMAELDHRGLRPDVSSTSKTESVLRDLL